MRKQVSRDPRRGFTLIELLVSIFVIGVLAGLFFPALNLIRQKAWDTAAQELCSQTVAAWDQFLITHRRFPDSEFLEKHLGRDVVNVGGDLAFPMDPVATSLLNWWKPMHPLSEFDEKNYETWLRTAARGRKIDFNEESWWDTIEDWPNDLLLERSVEQKKWGLVAPWASRYIKNVARRDDLDAEKREYVDLATVWVLIDTSGDGKLTLPENRLGAAALGPDDKPQSLPKSVVAWVYTDPKKSKIVTSW